MKAARPQAAIGYVVAAMLAVAVVNSFLSAPHPEGITYSEFKTLVKKGKVSNLLLDGHSITGTLATDGLEGVLSKSSTSSRDCGVQNAVQKRIRDATTEHRVSGHLSADTGDCRGAAPVRGSARLPLVTR